MEIRKLENETMEVGNSFSISTPLTMNRERSEKGAILVLVAVGMVFILGLAALVIDLGYLYLVDNQLQVAADGGSLAGAAKIADSSDCGDVGGSNYSARLEAQKFAGFNKAGSKVGQAGVVLDLNTSNAYVADGVIDASDGDIVLGNFTRGRTPHPFIRCEDPGGKPVNAVRVHARRNSDVGMGIDGSNDPVTTFFAPMVGFDEIGVKAFATAFFDRTELMIWSDGDVDFNSAGGRIDIELKDNAIARFHANGNMKTTSGITMPVTSQDDDSLLKIGATGGFEPDPGSSWIIDNTPGFGHLELAASAGAPGITMYPLPGDSTAQQAILDQVKAEAEAQGRYYDTDAILTMWNDLNAFNGTPASQTTLYVDGDLTIFNGTDTGMDYHLAYITVAAKGDITISAHFEGMHDGSETEVNVFVLSGGDTYIDGCTEDDVTGGAKHLKMVAFRSFGKFEMFKTPSLAPCKDIENTVILADESITIQLEEEGGGPGKIKLYDDISLSKSSPFGLFSTLKVRLLE